MTVDEWMASVPREIRDDSAWKMEAYRLAMFLADLAWKDGEKLRKNPRLFEVVDQLQRSTWRISSCIEEGYSRDTGKGRSTYYEYALGSARESRGWYYRGRAGLPPKVVATLAEDGR